MTSGEQQSLFGLTPSEKKLKAKRRRDRLYYWRNVDRIRERRRKRYAERKRQEAQIKLDMAVAKLKEAEVKLGKSAAKLRAENEV